ncbi:HEAT repeat domain-containing protein [Pseudomonas syringae pv. aptata]|uniref:HEAT repeat domain-containing protein n=2 Tax=Pseudomonas syringae TaxID=317 RepID=Q4ZWJ0_PSEU2|nr:MULTISPECIES: HEAT repeat domain-containing protein [Pseudomonas]AAY36482.1 hypothetical protein Psyr_1431 [Pseudomonas syringae pv. syringae B728a]MCK0546048.1 HEAT repeat domain-containing protein [Pseudomonas syringae pv. aptata]AVX24719.1 hypothetical protein DA456_15625 [Pseudomonas syringae pv. atrofaciens]MBI6745662.1 HEAT repeat domain-containing protein [Pseudomonas syringae]MBI6805145.1 HEAT repeat domain-containing protein [Pseudomonas syringae]
MAEVESDFRLLVDTNRNVMATHKELVAELINVLNSDGSSEVRAGAAKGLGAAGGADALRALRAALKHDSKILVRAASAEAVGLILGRGNLQDMMDQ